MQEFTFFDEIKCKFGSQAEIVFALFNKVFDVMPLVAIVDESIYCAHGGIPSCASKIDQIASIPSPLPDPTEIEVANEILWNDPITGHEFEELKNHPDVLSSVKNNKIPSGFLHNTKRSTGCFFSNFAMERFLDANGLSHLVRAHECIPPGYQYHAGGRCITIFSCSHYCK